MPGKMHECAPDAVRMMRGDKRAGVVRDGVGVGAETALYGTDGRRSGGAIEVNHRGEIECDTGFSECLRGQFRPVGGGLRVVERAQFLCGAGRGGNPYSCLRRLPPS